MSDDITTIIPEAVFVEVKGDRIEVKQIKVGQLTKIVQLAYPFYEKLRAMKDAARKEEKLRAINGDTSKEEVSLDLYGMVVEHSGAVVDILAILTDKDRAWVEDMGLDELVSLFGAVVEVNVDFFTQRVLPLLSKLVGDLVGMEKMQELVGQTPSKP